MVVLNVGETVSHRCEASAMDWKLKRGERVIWSHMSEYAGYGSWVAEALAL